MRGRPATDLARSSIEEQKITASHTNRWLLRFREKPYLRYFAVGAAYLALSLLVTWPMALHLSDSVPGLTNQDQRQNLWNLWWVRFSLLDLHTNPFHTTYLFYPYGVDLYLHVLDLTSGVFSIPLQLVWGLVPAYNLLQLFSLAMTGFATYLLATEIIGEGAGAFVAGVIMAFAPAHLTFMNGQIEFNSIFWLEFYLLLLLKMRAGFNWLYGLSGAALLALVGYTSLYQVLWALLLAGLALAWFGWKKRSKDYIKAYCLNLLITWVGFAVLFSPVLYGIIKSLSRGGINAELENDKGSETSLDLLGTFTQQDGSTLFGRVLGKEIETLWANPFIGFGALFLVGAGLYFMRKYRSGSGLGFFLLFGGIFGVIALGPYLTINGWVTDIPLPYLAVHALPFGDVVRNPFRYSEMLLLGLAPVAGFGFQQLMSYARRWPRVALGALVVFMLFFEYWPVPYQLSPTTIPAGYYALQNNGAVLNLPFYRKDELNADSMYYQTAHQQPILRGYLSRPPIDPYKTQDTSPLWVYQTFEASPDILTPGVDERLQDLLRLQGVGTVVLDKSDTSDSGKKAMGFLKMALGSGPYLDDGQLAFYQVPAGPVRPVLLLGTGWLSLEKETGDGLHRWIAQEAGFNIVVPEARSATIEFGASSYAQTRHLRVLVEGREAGTLTVPEGGTSFKLPGIKLNKGLNRVQLVAVEPPVSPLSLGAGNDKRELGILVKNVKLVE